MKISNTILLLSAIQGANAFLPQGPNALSFMGKAETMAPSYSYLSSLGGGELGSTPQRNGETATRNMSPEVTKNQFFARGPEEERTVRAF